MQTKSTVKAVTPRGKRLSFSRKNEWQAYSLSVIPLLFLFVFSYLPMFGIVIAFKNYRYDLGVWGSEWIGLKNFSFFFKSNDFIRILKNTLGLNAVFIAAGIVAAVAVALLLFEIKSRTRTKLFQTILITPYFLSWVVAGYMLYALLNPSFG
ncbi:MAG: sugar ABC transporter permease, partial [Clostridiales bacterium]|nr:sugar ABC transporter permease [Clostridiales bacterium]